MTLELTPQTVEQNAGPFTFPGVRVEGVNDITQFIIKAAPAQTNNLLEIQDNAGAEIITVTSSGNTIIDITSNEAFLVRQNADGGDVLLVNTTNSRVGIGINPLVDLHIGGRLRLQASNALLDIFSAGDPAAFYRFSADASGSTFFFSKSRHTTLGSHTIVQSGDTVGNFLARGSDGTNYISAAQIRFFIDGTPGVNDMPGRIAFYTTLDGDSSVTERMRINNAGDVSIGLVASASAQLHIDQPSTSGAQPVALFDQADIDEDFFAFIGTSDTSADRALVDAVDFTTPGAIAGYLKIRIQDDQATNPISDGDYYLHFFQVPTA